MTETPKPPFKNGQWVYDVEQFPNGFYIPDFGWYGGLRADLAKFIVDIVNQAAPGRQGWCGYCGEVRGHRVDCANIDTP